MVSWDDYLSAYTGKWTLDAFEVIERKLKPDGVDTDTLREEGATLEPEERTRSGERGRVQREVRPPADGRFERLYGRSTLPGKASKGRAWSA